MYRRVSLNLQTAIKNLTTGRDSFFFASAFFIEIVALRYPTAWKQSSNLLMRAKTLATAQALRWFRYKFIGGWVSSMSPALPGAHPCYSASVQIQSAVDDFFSRTGA